jgi:uncharacterized iron-regulated protein
MKQAVPWIVAGVFALATLGLYVQSQNVIKSKDVELQAAEAKYQSLVNESSAKARDAEARIEAAHTEAKRIATQANTQLDALAIEANAKIQAASLPEVPVAVSFRKAMLGSGSVATVKNISAQSIAVTITAARPNANEQRSFQQVIDGQQTTEIGHVEGWAFVKGDVVQVSLANHKAKRFSYN